MKKIIYSLAVISLGLFACSSPETPNYLVFSGDISNTDAEQIVITGPEFNQGIDIDSLGHFSDTLWIDTNGHYSFRVQYESSALYLQKGKNLNLSMDAKKFDESIQYSGLGAVENIALAKLYLCEEGVIGERNEFFAQEESAFLEDLQLMRDSSMALLSDPNLNAQFKAQEKKNADYTFALNLEKYPSYHAHYAEKEDFEASDEFMSNQIQIERNDEAAYKESKSYRNLVGYLFTKDINAAYEESLDYNRAIIEATGKVENTYIKEELLHGYARMLMSPTEDLQEIYDFLMAEVSNESYRASYEESFESLIKLAKGMPSPTFEAYENHSGGTTSFNDLKGKYTYIDVWATWCGPCLAEIPSLKEVEEAYHGKNINFVSTSIDQAEDHDTWLEMVNDKELGGMQLMADNAWQSEFVKNYQINGIPRFILVDPEGNIVSADAPRPSNPKLKELLDELDI